MKMVFSGEEVQSIILAHIREKWAIPDTRVKSITWQTLRLGGDKYDITYTVDMETNKGSPYREGGSK